MIVHTEERLRLLRIENTDKETESLCLSINGLYNIHYLPELHDTLCKVQRI